MDDVVVIKAAHHLGDGVGFADVGEELVAQAFAFGCARDESGDIDKFHRRRQHPLRFNDGRQRVQPRVGHVNDAGVRLNRAERVVLRVNPGVGQGIEECRFADVRQADDAAVKSHSMFPSGFA